MEVLSRHIHLDLERRDKWNRSVLDVASVACRQFLQEISQDLYVISYNFFNYFNCSTHAGDIMAVWAGVWSAYPAPLGVTCESFAGLVGVFLSEFVIIVLKSLAE